MSFSNYFTHKPGGDRIFSVEAPKIKFGRGSLHEVGDDAKALGMSRVAIFTDSVVAELEPVSKVVESLKSRGLDVIVYNQVTVEPTDISFKQGSKFARDGKFDGFVSVGGGSVMDTCKASNLYSWEWASMGLATFQRIISGRPWTTSREPGTLPASPLTRRRP